MTCVLRMVAERRRVCKQRSYSLAGPLSRSADWTEELELERRLRSREEDRGAGGGSGEYLEGYGGSQDRLRGGSQPICPTRRSSCGQLSTCGFQDVFTGEWTEAVDRVFTGVERDSRPCFIYRLVCSVQFNFILLHLLS